MISYTAGSFFRSNPLLLCVSVCVSILETVPICTAAVPSNVHTADSSDRGTLSVVTGYMPKEGMYVLRGEIPISPRRRHTVYIKEKTHPTNETGPKRSHNAIQTTRKRKQRILRKIKYTVVQANKFKETQTIRQLNHVPEKALNQPSSGSSSPTALSAQVDTTTNTK